MKRPRDQNQLAKALVDLATGVAVEINPDAGKNPAAVALGKLGGSKGGKARAARMTAAERKASSAKAIAARWGKNKK